MVIPHPDAADRCVSCAVITVSDSRTLQTDTSGALIQEMLSHSGHQTVVYRLVKDEPGQIQTLLDELAQPEIEAMIFTGGTGLAARDTTYDAIAPQLDKQLPGFGELFRWLSYQQIGSRAMASRATAGTYRNTLVFSLPGSRHAVQLAMETLILPELRHLVSVLRG
jgi:molybdenum cofactor biosynthesis protein B